MESKRTAKMMSEALRTLLAGGVLFLAGFALGVWVNEAFSEGPKPMVSPKSPMISTVPVVEEKPVVEFKAKRKTMVIKPDPNIPRPGQVWADSDNNSPWAGMGRFSHVREVKDGWVLYTAISDNTEYDFESSSKIEDFVRFKKNPVPFEEFKKVRQLRRKRLYNDF